MKKFKILWLLPILALAACGGKGQEVDNAKAKDVAANIATSSKEAKMVDFTMEMTDYDADSKNNSTTTYTYKKVENGDIYCTISGSGTDAENKRTSSSAELYLVKNDKYEEVFYYHMKSTGSEENDNYENYSVYGKKGNEAMYATVVSSYGVATTTMTKGMYEGFADPSALVASSQLEEAEGYEIKYYSSGNKNLVIEVKLSRDKAISEDDDTKMANATYTYKDGMFEKCEIEAEYFDGSKMSQKCSAKYSGVKIPELPDGWESKMSQSLL